jgi:lysophospholipase L1-like esterase
MFRAAVENAPAELVFTNYSAARPLKIMAVGDSITDDCSINGAWRDYLQQFLDQNRYPFTFVGRWTSTGSGVFTKTRHEGMCGAVIAAPGVMTSAVHGYSGPNVYLMKSVRDALTNITADLVLVVMGANDIGRGRDPAWVAHNDMPALLDLIFSNLPQANIIVTKPTTLRNAVNGYAAYATNGFVYSDDIQVMVNARRAQGQNVFLADMFSVVDYGTGFLSDHLHPNASGLIYMAKEFFSRIQAITLRTNVFDTLLIPGGSDWKYSDTGQDLGTNWTLPDYDDSAWSHGPGQFGYGEPTVATTVSYGTNAANKNTTTYFRRQFVVPDNVGLTNLNFHLLRRDGAVVWLNGAEVFRANLPAGVISYTNQALSLTVNEAAHSYFQSNVVVSSPLTGTNVVAVEIHPVSPLAQSIGFDLELLGTGFIPPPPSLSMAATATNLWLGWPVTNSVGFTLCSATNLTSSAAWSVVGDPIQTNGGLLTLPLLPDDGQRFFRLQKP